MINCWTEKLLESGLHGGERILVGYSFFASVSEAICMEIDWS
jgi:hypothetical protein